MSPSFARGRLPYQVAAIAGVRSCSAGEALDYLAAGPTPRLIVLDIALPDIQGDQLYARIRADLVLAMVPVLVLTGQEEPPELPGVTATLVKGISAEVLLRMIDAACRRETVRDFG
jgi:CheY-like chemotaxis protein